MDYPNIESLLAEMNVPLNEGMRKCQKRPIIRQRRPTNTGMCRSMKV